LLRETAVADARIDIHRCKQGALGALFRTLLLQLMTAQIRAHNVDLEEVEALA